MSKKEHINSHSPPLRPDEPVGALAAPESKIKYGSYNYTLDLSGTAHRRAELESAGVGLGRLCSACSGKRGSGGAGGHVGAALYGEG